MKTKEEKMNTFISFYHSAHMVEDERIVSLLREQSIQADYHEQLPGVETGGQYRIFVAAPEHQETLRIILNARKDGIISHQGQFAKEC